MEQRAFEERLKEELEENYELFLERALQSDITVGALAEMVLDVHSRKEAVQKLRNVLEAQVIGSVLSKTLYRNSTRENIQALADGVISKRDFETLFQSWDQQVNDERISAILDDYIFDFTED